MALLSFLTLLITVALWSVLWSVGAVQYRAYIDNWIEAHRALGYRVTYDSRATVGFPRHITLHYSNLMLQNPDGIKIYANDVSLSAFPWHWNDFDAKLKHGFEITISFSDAKILSIRTDFAARNHTQLDANGDWLFVNLELLKARALWGSSPFFAAESFEVALQRPDRAPKDRRDTGLTFTAKMEDLAVPDDYAVPFGPHVQTIDIAMRVMGPVPDPRMRDSVAAWNNGGNTVEFNKFSLVWGPLLLLSKGVLGFDDDLQPQGAFSAQIGNHEQVLKTLMANGYIPQHETSLLDSALNLFTKKTTVAGHDGIEAPITVQLGGLFLGPVRVFEYPDIKWASSPLAPASAVQ